MCVVVNKGVLCNVYCNFIVCVFMILILVILRSAYDVFAFIMSRFVFSITDCCPFVGLWPYMGKIGPYFMTVALNLWVATIKFCPIIHFTSRIAIEMRLASCHFDDRNISVCLIVKQWDRSYRYSIIKKNCSCSSSFVALK